VGGLVAEAWNLPAAVCHSARWHHSPDAAPDSRQLVDLVHVADCLAHSLSFGADVGELSREMMQGAMDRLGGTEQVLEEVAAEAFEHAETMGTMVVGPGGEDE
jgi:HD-like signal output (HDOD) protein